MNISRHILFQMNSIIRPLKKIIYSLVFMLLALSCNYFKSPKNLDFGTKNTIASTKPSLMIFPSDNLLKRANCIKEVDNQGTISYIRDYKKAFVNDDKLKFVIASIQELFANNGYPIESLEQQLKQIDNQNASDEMESLAKDPKTILLNTARPDFIIEIDYQEMQDPETRDPRMLCNYILTANDVYTNKVVASITQADLKSEEDKSIDATIKESLAKKIDEFQGQLKNRFDDINSNGAEITLRISVDDKASLNLGDECLGTQNYNDWINDWLKKNTLHQTFKPQLNTNSELKYLNVRIKATSDDGLKYTAYDFANDLKKDISKGCGISVDNKTQGIGDAYLIVKGLK